MNALQIHQTASLCCASYLKGRSKYVTENEGKYAVRADVEPGDKQVFDIALKIFDLKPGQAIQEPSKGALLNEFLSALVTMDLMKDLNHSPTSMAQVATMIEGTIPFRGEGHFYSLAERLKQANIDLNLGLSGAQVNHTIKAAVFEANKDVLGFAGNEAATDIERLRECTSGTWKLMPEMNMRFRGENITPAEFRGSMAGNHFFFTKVLTDPNKRVFHAFDGYPLPAELATLQKHEQEVRGGTDLYLKAKTVSAALVEAVASQVEANTSLIDMVNGVGGFLPTISSNGGESLGERTLRAEARAALDVLKHGRKGTSTFDIPTSPIGARIFETLGEEGVTKLFDAVGKNIKPDAKDYRQFLADAISIMGKEFDVVAGALASVAQTRGYSMRSENILGLANEIVPTRFEYMDKQRAEQRVFAASIA